MKNVPLRSLLVALAAISFVLTTTPSWAQWVQTATLTGSDGQPRDFFGATLAVDGNTLVVGATGRNHAGIAYVFTESNGVWTQVAELSPSDSFFGQNFGGSIAVSGNTVVVGDGGSARPKSAIYVFVKPATGWTNMTQTAKLTPSDANPAGSFPSSLTISNDTIAAGDFQHQVANNQGQGTVYVFVKPATGWTDMTQTAELTASDGVANDGLGVSVALKGSTLVAGAGIFSSNSAGAAYVFEKPASGWANGQQTAKLTASDPKTDATLGLHVAISNDEATIVAGAPGSTLGPDGAAYIFTKPATGWQNATQSSELIAPPPAGLGLFGTVAINGPGTIMAVGAPNTMVGFRRDAGDAYVYRKPATGWPPLPQANARLNPPFPERGGSFGQAMAVRATTVFAGEFNATVNANPRQGAVYVFDRPR